METFVKRTYVLEPQVCRLFTLSVIKTNEAIYFFKKTQIYNDRFLL